MAEDNWQHRSNKMRCETCMWWVPKVTAAFQVVDPAGIEPLVNAFPKKMLGRCRRYAPTMAGWPAVFDTDWCGNHKMDENKI